MTLTPGTHIGPYEITAQIGEGGMGVVWKARDLALAREVAIKVLPGEFTADPERTARFEREAKLLAQLNHPNIAQIYGFETSGDTRALVMELVEGPTLADRLASGALSLDESLAIARQIAEALEEAHEKGIVHRDLKPQNVKASVAGKVKVLDFGLAKAMDPVSAAGMTPSDLAHSPTVTFGATREGVILGTAAYMAPEQAAGGIADRRSDVWSFGVVLYEMLSGRRLFAGETVSHVLAGVLKEEPDFSTLPPETPTRIVNLLRRCLRKKPRERLQAIGDARVVLDEVLAEPLSDEPRSSLTLTPAAPSPRLAWLIAAGAVVAAVVFAALWRTAPDLARDRSIHAALTQPEGTMLGDSFALSPDGRRLVLQALDMESGLSSLWLRELDRREALRLVGTEGAELPFWSPDGNRIGFFAEGTLKRIDPRGGPPQSVCDAPTPRGGTWSVDGRIAFAASFRSGLSIVSASGGEPQPLTTLDAARGEKSHRFPVFLPDGRRLLFLSQTAEGGAKNDASRIEVLDLASNERAPLLTVNSSPLFAPPGFLLFFRDGTLLAKRFDVARLHLADDAFPVASPVAFNQNEQVLASISNEGTLVLREALESTLSSLVLLDRDGVQRTVLRELENFHYGLAVSHDGTRVAVPYYPPGQGAKDLWIFDLERAISNRLTFEDGNDWNPAWTRDDKALYYDNDLRNDGVVFRRAADGTGAAEEIATSDSGLFVYAVSSDGRWLVVGDVEDATGTDLLRLDLATRKLEPLVASPFSDSTGALSPDDRLLAFASDESGRSEVYVQSLTGSQGRWQVSVGGGILPQWRGDGRELFYVVPPDRLFAVAVEPGDVPRFAAPEELFRLPFTDYDVFPDGQRFVVLSPSDGGSSRPLTLITNWSTRLPVR